MADYYHLRALVNGLLQLSILSTKVQSFQEVDLNEVTAQILADLDQKIQKSRGVVDVSKLPVIEADPAQMQRLLQHLIENALKFQPAGGMPRVTIYSVQSTPFRDTIQVACGATLETRFVWDRFELVDFLKTNSEYRMSAIVLDLNMPGKDGRTALREIKTDPDLAHIPVVVLTTSQNASDLQYCQKYGVSGYYQKPSSMQELKKIFNTLCTDYIH